MQRTKRVRSQRRRVFTLLEVLLVVGIIALLAAFVVPSFIGARSGAEDDIAKAIVDNGGQLAGQLEIYRLHMGKYPEELKQLVEKPEGDDAGKWRGPYIQDVAKLKDPWGNELKFKCPGEVNTESYDLWSTGRDGQDGTDDDVTNYSKEKR